MKVFNTLLFMANITLVSAQPVLTGDEINADPGEVFTEYHLDYDTSLIKPGTAGENQVWNFLNLSNFSLDTNVVRWIDLSTVPSNISQSYPGSNLVFNGGDQSYEFYSVSSTESIRTGTYANDPNIGPIVAKMDDPYVYLTFPLEYSDRFEDYWEANPVVLGITIHRRGNDTTVADGYGDLILPSGTFENVLRLKTNSVWKDSSSATGDNDLANITYTWFQPGYHHPLLLLNYTYNINTGQEDSKTAYYTTKGNVFTTGIEGSTEKPLGIQMFPNPAKNVLNMAFSSTPSSAIEVRIVDLAGREVLYASYPPGSTASSMDVSALKAGAYFVQFSSAGRFHAEKLLIQENID